MKHLLTIAVAVALFACGGASGPRQLPPPPAGGPPTALQVDKPVYIPGEYIAWELSWKGIAGGKTRLMVGEPGTIDGRRAIIVRSETRSDGLLAMFRHVRDDLITTIDLDSSLPIESHGVFEFGKRGKQIKNTKVYATFNGDSYNIEYERKGVPRRSWTQNLPEGEVAYDTHSVLGALRAWEPEDGDRVYFYSLSGRRLYRVEVTASIRETLTIGLGTYPARRFEGVGTRLARNLATNAKRKPRHFSVWVSDDADRVPLLVRARTEFGDVQVELVEYQGAASVAKR